ncbi:MAG: hypothetical protein NC311_16575 [Muribaculaceae bacterium]|nr:hypothetical protein [Muribaculaceae bacterium]
MESIFYRNITPEARAAYRNVVDAVRNQKKEVLLEKIGDIEQLNIDVRESFPELFYLPIEWKQRTGLAGRTLIFTYAYSKSQIAEIGRELRAEAGRIIGECMNDHQGDYDKAIVLHDYLKNHVRYDHRNASMPSSGPESRPFLEAHSIVGALLRKSCVCEGFAKAFMYLCGMAGLECYCISGTGNSVYERGPHMWNIVRMNGYYHHVDVTWDNQFNDDVSLPNYCYFGLDDKAISRDHSWDKRNYAACEDAPYNYFKMNNSLMTTKVQLERFLKDHFEMEEKHILFRVDVNSRLAMEVPGCLGEVIRAASSKSRYVSVNGWESQFFQEQLVYSVTPSYDYL